MALFWTCLLSASAAGLVWIIWHWLRPFHIPAGQKQLPGPWGVPLLGYMPWLGGGQRPHQLFQSMRRRYGDMFLVPLGVRHVLVLHDYQLIREAYAKDAAFAGRPEFLRSVKTIVDSGGQSRFVFRTGNAMWRFLRKSAVKAIGLFATSRNSRLNEITVSAARDLVAQLTASAGRPHDPHLNIFECTAKVIGTVNFANQYDGNDPLLLKSIEVTEAIASFVQLGSAMDFLPGTRLLSQRRIANFLKALSPVNELTEKLILAHSCRSSEAEVRDIADALHVTALQTPDEVKRALGLTDQKIRFISQDLFGAGFGTTMETLRWALNLLAIHPSCQDAAKTQIDRVIGDREISLADLHALPYVDAILLEVLRVSSLIPMSLPHSTMQSTSLRGYHIPANVIVFANIYAHHRDPAYFPDPHAFRPERYLKDDGSLDMQQHELVVAFGVGKRRCVGENLARQELYLLLASVLQRLRIAPAPGVVIDPERHGGGITRRPIKYELMFHSR